MDDFFRLFWAIGHAVREKNKSKISQWRICLIIRNATKSWELIMFALSMTIFQNLSGFLVRFCQSKVDHHRWTIMRSVVPAISIKNQDFNSWQNNSVMGAKKVAYFTEKLICDHKKVDSSLCRNNFCWDFWKFVEHYNNRLC